MARPKPRGIEPFKGKHKGGAPSPYNVKFAHVAKTLSERGATNLEIADALSINMSTFLRWRNRHPEFCEALRIGGELADARVEKSLYERAIGYTFESEKIVTAGKQVIRVPIREHVPPDIGAAKLWLGNRKRDDWPDAKDQGPSGGVSIEQLVVQVVERRNELKAQAEAATKVIEGEKN